MIRRHQSWKKSGGQRGNNPCKSQQVVKTWHVWETEKVAESQGMRRKGVEGKVSRAQVMSASWVRGRHFHLILRMIESQ